MRRLFLLAAAILVVLAGPAPAQARADGDVFTGTREVALGFESGPPSYAILNTSGLLTGWSEPTSRGRFVLVRTHGEYLIRTAWKDSSGNHACLGTRRDGEGVMRLWAAVCRGSAGQRFTFTRTDRPDSAGRTTYIVATGAGRLIFNSFYGLHIELDYRPNPTAFSLQDLGPVRTR
jgi:hypothetical protein